MVSPICLHMMNFIMWVIAPGSWYSCRKIFRILIKESLAIKFLFFTMRFTTFRAVRLVLADSRTFISFCSRLYLVEVGIFPQFEVDLML